MKRLLWIFIMVLPLCISGCSDDETQQITCAIQVPSDGETIQVRADEKLFIRGYGKADHGQIVSAELKVAGSVISDVTTVPFYYGYSLPEEQTEGELKLELTVWGETGATATASGDRSGYGCRKAVKDPGLRRGSSPHIHLSAHVSRWFQGYRPPHIPLL